MKLIITVLLIITISYSCKKKDDRVTKPISETVIKSIPYKDGQVVVFNTNKLGTISTVVQRKFLILKPSSPLISEEYLEVNLKRSSNNTDFINFLARGMSAADSVVQFNITPYGDFYNIIQFVTHENGLMNSFLYNGKSIFHDTYTLKNINYNNVLELYWEKQADVRSINRLFYNKEFGVLHYETSDGLIGDLTHI